MRPPGQSTLLGVADAASITSLGQSNPSLHSEDLTSEATGEGAVGEGPLAVDKHMLDSIRFNSRLEI